MPSVSRHDLDIAQTPLSTSSDAIATCPGSASRPTTRPPGETRSNNSSRMPRGPQPRSRRCRQAANQPGQAEPCYRALAPPPDAASERSRDAATKGVDSVRIALYANPRWANLARCSSSLSLGLWNCDRYGQSTAVWGRSQRSTCETPCPVRAVTHESFPPPTAVSLRFCNVTRPATTSRLLL